MFTGLIEAVGEVAGVAPSAAGSRLRIITALADELTPGDSLAVNGVCLTVVAASAATGIETDVSPETARITTMGTVRPGAQLCEALPAVARPDGLQMGRMCVGATSRRAASTST